MSAKKDMEARFGRACDALFGALKGGEALAVEFEGEDSTFLRFNRGKVRQLGSVERADLTLRFYANGRTLGSGTGLTGDADADAKACAALVERLRGLAAGLPEDPFQVLPAATGSSREEFAGRMPDGARLVEEVLEPGDAIARAGADFVGLHAQGPVCRGAAASSGARHWFATEIFAADWSAYLPNGKAVKSCYAGREWDGAEWRRRLAAELPRLEALDRPERILPPGEYRVWLAPDAVDAFLPFFSRMGLSERAYREGSSAWTALRDGRKKLSPKFSLAQDFSLGAEPRFNESGELAPERLPLVEGGAFANAIVSSRSEKQYGAVSNAAPEWEGVRSPSVASGDFDDAKALEAIGTGLYVSNLHYLNWSDFDSARVTGMTRFACVWVEDGKIVAPIKDLRFDESLYRLWGDKLEAVGSRRAFVAETGSYLIRNLGGSLVPGMLIDGMTFTL